MSILKHVYEDQKVKVTYDVELEGTQVKLPSGVTVAVVIDGDKLIVSCPLVCKMKLATIRGLPSVIVSKK